MATYFGQRILHSSLSLQSQSFYSSPPSLPNPALATLRLYRFIKELLQTFKEKVIPVVYNLFLNRFNHKKNQLQNPDKDDKQYSNNRIKRIHNYIHIYTSVQECTMTEY